jgi:hypothetical protein
MIVTLSFLLPVLPSQFLSLVVPDVRPHPRSSLLLSTARSLPRVAWGCLPMTLHQGDAHRREHWKGCRRETVVEKGQMAGLQDDCMVISRTHTSSSKP